MDDVRRSHGDDSGIISARSDRRSRHRALWALAAVVTFALSAVLIGFSAGDCDPLDCQTSSVLTNPGQAALAFAFLSIAVYLTIRAVKAGR